MSAAEDVGREWVRRLKMGGYRCGDINDMTDIESRPPKSRNRRRRSSPRDVPVSAFSISADEDMSRATVEEQSSEVGMKRSDRGREPLVYV